MRRSQGGENFQPYPVKGRPIHGDGILRKGGEMIYIEERRLSKEIKIFEESRHLVPDEAEPEASMILEGIVVALCAIGNRPLPDDLASREGPAEIYKDMRVSLHTHD